MKITTQKEEELKREWPLLPDGEYPFTVLESDEIPSKSEKNIGRMMYAVKLNVHNRNGDQHVYDYFADWFSAWKLRHFAATTGQLAAYESGDLDGSLGKFNGKVGYVKIKTKPAGRYPAKNVVDDYIARESASSQEKPLEAESPDDDVPF